MNDRKISPEEKEAERRRQMLFLIESIYAQQNALFLRHCFHVPELERILRWSCVHVALEDPEFATKGRDAAYQQTLSLAAVLTGLARREVAEVAQMPRPDVYPEGGYVPHLVRVLTAWRTEESYQDELGNPIDLHLRGPAPSLHKLCMKHGYGCATRALADVLVKNGNAAWIGKSEGNTRTKKLRFLHPVVTAAIDSPENVAIMAQICNDFLHSFRQMFNPDASARPRFREGYFSDIDADMADQAMREMHEGIHAFNIRCTQLLAKYRAAPGRPTVRLGVGSYSFRSAPLLAQKSGSPDVQPRAD